MKVLIDPSGADISGLYRELSVQIDEFADINVLTCGLKIQSIRIQKILFYRQLIMS